MEISNNYAWKFLYGKLANSPLLPSNIRGLIVEKRNCGKTTLLLNLLLQPNWLDYDTCLVRVYTNRNIESFKKDLVVGGSDGGGG